MSATLTKPFNRKGRHHRGTHAPRGSEARRRNEIANTCSSMARWRRRSWRCYRTWCYARSDLGVHPWVVKAHLNHVSGVVSGVTVIYKRYSYLKEARPAIRLFEDHFSTALRSTLTEAGTLAAIARTYNLYSHLDEVKKLCSAMSKSFCEHSPKKKYNREYTLAGRLG